MTVPASGLPPELLPHVPPRRSRARAVSVMLTTVVVFGIALFFVLSSGADVQRTARVLPTDLWSEPVLQASTIAIPLPAPADTVTAATQPPPVALVASAAPSLGALPSTAPSVTAPTRGPYPPPGLDASPTPLGTPADVAVPDPRHTFTAFAADGVTPIAYDPCRPIRYVMRPDNAPPEAAALIRGAFDRLTQVTGLQFVDAGLTDEVPSIDRAAYQPDRYGDQWAPVLVGWATEAEVPVLAGNVAGAAGSTSAKAGDLEAVYVSGGLILDGPQLSEVWADVTTRAAVRAVVLHEMAHLVGLGHVEDPTQLMNPQSSASTTVLDYQDGDLTGLVRLGAGPCVPQV